MKRITTGRLIALILAGAGLAAFHSNEARATEFSGIFTVNLTVYLTTALPSGATVGCTLNLNLSGSDRVSETVETLANVSGSTATCTLVIPYLWDLSASGSDSVSAQYGAAIIAPTINALNGQLVSDNQLLRQNSQNLVPFTGIPATGTHTTLNLSTRL